MTPEERELDPHERLCLRLGIPYDPHDQDFGIMHADPKRVLEFISLFWKWNLQDYGREMLFELIFASFDELLQSDPDLKLATKVEAKIRDVVRSSPNRFQFELEYWGRTDFDASSTARKLLTELPEEPESFRDYWLKGEYTLAGLVLRKTIGPDKMTRMSYRVLASLVMPLELEGLQLALQPIIESGHWSRSNELYLKIRQQRLHEPDARDHDALGRASLLQMLENLSLMACEAWQTLPESPQNPDLEFLRGFASFTSTRMLSNNRSLAQLEAALKGLACDPRSLVLTEKTDPHRGNLPKPPASDLRHDS